MSFALSDNSPVSAQIMAARDITVNEADSTYKSQLVQPTYLLINLGFTQSDIEQELVDRPRISIIGAGSVRISRVAQFTDSEPSHSGVEVVAAGSVRDIALPTPQIVQPTIEPTLDIVVAGAGSVRLVRFSRPESE